MAARPAAFHLAGGGRGHGGALPGGRGRPRLPEAAHLSPPPCRTPVHHTEEAALITVDFTRLPVGPGNRVLDLGCGNGRHAFETFRRGADVVAFDQNGDDLAEVAAMFAAMRAEGVPEPAARTDTVQGDALHLPFPDGSFDRAVASEIFEHIPHDTAAMAELHRVLRPGGLAAVTVPSWLPERLCWALSEEYHTNEGGHVRIYTRAELAAKLKAAGFRIGPHHHAHALHTPYWWIKCAVGPGNEAHPLARGYHRLLVWDILRAPRITRTTERLLNPLLGKSVVLYLRKPSAAAGPSAAATRTAESSA